MKLQRYLLAALAAITISTAMAQVESGSGVRRRTEKENNGKNTGAQVTDRMQKFYEKSGVSDADLVWMREIYRSIDLNKDANTPLYYPEDVVDGQENLFRLMLRLVVDGTIPAYEYLDGREVFTDQYKIKVGEMLDRFGIYYTAGKGSTEKNPKYLIEEADVPTAQVQNFYILEKWEFDKRTNQMKTFVEAICPVLNRSGDYGGEAKYPMFWIKFDALRPYMAQQYVFLSDDNNLARYSLDDFFTLGMYDGDIYKTKNLRNLSLNQIFPDEEELKAAQDSIDNRLRNFGKDLWVPSREDFLAQKEQQETTSDIDETAISDRPEGDAGQTTVGVTSTRAKKNVRSSRRPRPKVKNSSVKKSSSSSSTPSSSAEKSVRRRKK